tara:strand:- start:729 stop:1328 length:600 start_codon:yes stop_codon:yes gene_type:complete
MKNKKINKILKKKFFERHSNIVAPLLIGCRLVRIYNDNDILHGIIVETEAYSQEDEACHGFNKKTKSNEVLFGDPGTFYVYKSYGIHHCLNIVTHKNNFASGVLIRSVFINNEEERVASGPGLITKKFLINKDFNGVKSYDNSHLKILKRDIKVSKEDLLQTTRIGIRKATNLQWRWYLKSSRSISKREKGDKTPPKFS